MKDKDGVRESATQETHTWTAHAKTPAVSREGGRESMERCVSTGRPSETAGTIKGTFSPWNRA